MFNVLSKGNANQNDTKISFHTSKNGYQEHKQQMLMSMWGEKRNILHCWWGNVNSAGTVEISMEVSFFFFLNKQTKKPQTLFVQ
jgi:hypothetical protein